MKYVIPTLFVLFGMTNMASAMTARTIINPATGAPLNSAIMRNELQILENEIVSVSLSNTSSTTLLTDTNTWSGLQTFGNITISGICTGCGSSGVGTVSTSTTPTIGNLAYWTSAGYPSLLGSVATGTISNGAGISVTAGQSVIGSGLTITNTAPDQTVAFTNGTGISVTGTYPNFTVTNSSPLSGLTATWPQILSGTTLTFGGLSTSSPISAASGLLYATGVNTLASISTSSALQMSITGNAGSATDLTSKGAGVYGTPSSAVPSMQATSTLYGPIATFLTTGNVGIASTSPFGLFSINPSGITTPAFTIGSTTRTTFAVGASGQIKSIGSQPATSTAITLDWDNTPNFVEYRIGTAATTITFINATTTLNYGSRKLISVWNPNSTAGALTLTGVEFASAYTQTTGANRGDLISCVVSLATSTTAYKVICTAGAASQ